jgi:hypothetical protein
VKTSLGVPYRLLWISCASLPNFYCNKETTNIVNSQMDNINITFFLVDLVAPNWFKKSFFELTTFKMRFRDRIVVREIDVCALVQILSGWYWSTSARTSSSRTSVSKSSKTTFLQFGWRKFRKSENKSLLIRLTLSQSHGQAKRYSIHKRNTYDKSGIMFVSKNIVRSEKTYSAHSRKWSTRSFVARASNNALMCEKCLLALIW